MMDYDKLWYKKLKLQAKTDYKMFTKIDKLFFQKNADRLALVWHSLHIKLVIKDGKIEIVKDDSFLDSHNRIPRAKQFIEKTLEYIKKNNYKSIDGEFIMSIGDSFDIDPKIPIISYSKPKNVKGFLFPDFHMNLLEEKKELFEEKCSDIEKINKIYFKGNSTSKNNTKIREKLSPLSDDILNISLDKTDFKPFYDICRYKYVLDIPGNRPWSVRLIELYLSKSLPLRINFYSSEKKNNKFYKYDQWIQFYELMFPENESYINFAYNNYYLQEISNNKIQQIKKDLINKYKYFEKNPELYYKIVNENFEKTKYFTMNHIYYYIYKMFKYYNKLIKK